MKILRQLGGGLILGLLSIIIIVGAMSLAFAESYVPQPSPTSTSTKPASLTPVITPIIPTTPSLASTATSTATFTASPILPTTCPPPAGWFLVTIQPGDTLDILTVRYRTTSGALISANCEDIEPPAGLRHLRSPLADQHTCTVRRAVWMGPVHHSTRGYPLPHQPALSHHADATQAG